MNFPVLGLGIATTLAGVLAHIAWWRIRRPHDDVRALAMAVGLFPLALTLAGAWWGEPFRPSPAPSAFDHLLQSGALAIMHAFFALVYMSCYTAAQAASPTVLIVLLAQQAPDGVTREEINDRLTDDLVCGDLVQAAIHEKFITETDGRLSVGPRGRLLLLLGRTARKLVGLSAPIG